MLETLNLDTEEVGSDGKEGVTQNDNRDDEFAIPSVNIKIHWDPPEPHTDLKSYQKEKKQTRPHVDGFTEYTGNNKHSASFCFTLSNTY